MNPWVFWLDVQLTFPDFTRVSALSSQVSWELRPARPKGPPSPGSLVLREAGLEARPTQRSPPRLQEQETLVLGRRSHKDCTARRFATPGAGTSGSGVLPEATSSTGTLADAVSLLLLPPPSAWVPRSTGGDIKEELLLLSWREVDARSPTGCARSCTVDQSRARADLS